MKTVLALIVLGSFSFTLAFKDLWQDPKEIAWDTPTSIKFAGRDYLCNEVEGCGCPMLLCSGNKSCKREDDNPIKCQLTKAWNKIDLTNAKLEYFFKGSGDCKCNPL